MGWKFEPHDWLEKYVTTEIGTSLYERLTEASDSGEPLEYEGATYRVEGPVALHFPEDEKGTVDYALIPIEEAGEPTPETS